MNKAEFIEECAICGARENLQKHHVSYEPEIIQLLCVDCHKAVHNHGVGKAPGWTPLFGWLKEDAEILFKEGATNKEVAKACDIFRATASHWRKKLGLGLPQWARGIKYPYRKRWKRKESDVVLSFMINPKIKNQLKKIAQSFDEGVFTGDIAETILLAFFKGNAQPKDMEVARELIIRKKKEGW